MSGSVGTVPKQGAPWLPSREDILRARDRVSVRAARIAHRPFALLLLLAGPGILAMLGENDGPSMLSYATTGAKYGIGFFLPFILLTFLMAFVVQEMTVRLGIATHRGHAELIFDRFGPFWGYFAMGDLVIGNILTLITEFIAVRAGAAYFGIPPWIAVSAALLLVLGAMSARRYFTWERFVMVLAAGNMLFIPAALLSHPNPAAVSHAFLTWQPFPGGPHKDVLTLILANIGATVTPWMIFFQQSAVVDKGLTRSDLPQGRMDTAIGALLAAAVAIAGVLVCSTLSVHGVAAKSFSSGADFATVLRPIIGNSGATLFALGMIEAGLVAAMTISTSSAYALAEAFHKGRSLNLEFSQGALFYSTGLISMLVAVGIVMIPHAPLLAITITVNVIATMLMAPALLFLLLLVNDREIIGTLANTLRGNTIAGAIVIGIALIGAFYGFITIFPSLLKG